MPAGHLDRTALRTRGVEAAGRLGTGQARGAVADRGCGAVTVAGGQVVTGVTGLPLGTRSGSAGVAAEAADSRLRKAPSSPMVLISGAGKTTVVFLSTPISTRLCRLR